MELFFNNSRGNHKAWSRSPRAESEIIESHGLISPSHFFSSLALKNQLCLNQNNFKHHPNQQMSPHLAYNEENFGDQGEEFNIDEKVQYNKDIGFLKFTDAQKRNKINMSNNNFNNEHNAYSENNENNENNEYERPDFMGFVDVEPRRPQQKRTRIKLSRYPSQEAILAEFYKRSEQTLEMQRMLWEEDEVDVVEDLITLINP